MNKKTIFIFIAIISLFIISLFISERTEIPDNPTEALLLGINLFKYPEERLTKENAILEIKESQVLKKITNIINNAEQIENGGEKENNLDIKFDYILEIESEAAVGFRNTTILLSFDDENNIIYFKYQWPEFVYLFRIPEKNTTELKIILQIQRRSV